MSRAVPQMTLNQYPNGKNTLYKTTHSSQTPTQLDPILADTTLTNTNALLDQP